MMMPPTIHVFDGEPNKYRLFKMQFQNLYHRRCPDDATRLSFLTGLRLSEKVIKKLQDGIDCPESYVYLWQRLEDEFGHIAIKASTTLNKLLDYPVLRATKGKLVAEYAVEVHSAISAVSQCELKTELTSLSALRQVANKLPPVMREKWSEERYKRLPEIPTLIDFDEWLTTKTKGKDWNVWFHGPRQDNKTSESKDDKTLQTSKSKPKKSQVEKSTINLVTTNMTPSSSQRPPSSKLPAGERNDKPRPSCFVCAAERHKIEDCPVFTSMIPNKRAETIFSNNHCMTCLF